jgi:hypothetical protein
MKKIILIASLLASSSLFAQEIVTDRPDQTESPIAVDVGVLQIETGLLFEQYSAGSGFLVRRSVYPTNLFRIGLLKRLELRIVNEVVTYKTSSNNALIEDEKVSGSENMQLGLKYQLTNSDAKLVVGAMAHVVVPTGSDGISNDRYGIFSRINLSYDLDESKNLSANFGYNNYDLEFDGGELQRVEDGNFTYTFVYGVGISDRVGMYLEAFGDYVNFNYWSNNMDAGMTFLLKENIQLDYSYGWGLDSDLNYHSVGVSVRLPK